MPSPIGHALAGMALSRIWRHSHSPIPAGWRSTVAIGITANLPDVDTLGYFLGDRTSVLSWLHHRGPVHSLGAAVIFTLLVFVVLQPKGARFAARWASVLGAVYISHVLLDYFNADSGRPRGVPLFWPISDAYHISPATIFLNIEWRDRSTWVTRHHVVAILIEVLVLLPLLLVRWPEKQRQSETTHPVKHSVADAPDTQAP